MELLQLKNVHYEDNGLKILKNINLNISKGDLVSIVGSSGSGKSTLLKLCSDLISESSGDIFFKGKNFKDYDPLILRKEISYVVQNPILFGDTVFDNLNFPFEIRGEKFNKERVTYLLNKLNLSEDYLSKSISSLSGGEKQRISLIRTLIFIPKILLLDEVTSALDPENSKVVENFIKELNKDGLTIVWVTHNISQSKSIFNKRITVSLGEIINREEF